MDYESEHKPIWSLYDGILGGREVSGAWIVPESIRLAQNDLQKGDFGGRGGERGHRGWIIAMGWLHKATQGR